PTIDSSATDNRTEYDYIIIGSGAGGGPLAVRLAEAGHTVLVVDAGPATSSRDVYDVPAFHLFASSDPEISWDFWVKHYTDPTKHGSAYIPQHGGVLYPRASTLGGCTTHHALLMLAPELEDWNYIARHTGDPSWNAAIMNKYLQRVREWLPIETSPASLLARDTTLARIVTATITQHPAHNLTPADIDLNNLTAKGTLFDPNDPAAVEATRTGACLVPQSSRNGHRYGTRDRLLDAAPRLTRHLFFQTDALVERITFDRGRTNRPRATGIDLVISPRAYGASPIQHRINTDQRNKNRRHITARREIIVAAGAFNTPQLLMLSGIGDPKQLQRHGIQTIIASPGVGENLQDRYEMTVVTEFDRRFALLRDAAFGAPGDLELQRWRSGDPNALYRSNGLLIGLKEKFDGGSDHPELFIFGAPSHFTGYRPNFAEDGVRSRRHFNWAIIRGYQQSMSGYVRLRSADPTATPDINFRYFDDGTNTPGAQADLAAMRQGFRHARSVNDLARKLRFTDAARDHEIYPGPTINGPNLDNLIRRDAWGHHASCTAPMGPDNSPKAVLDSRFRVRGAENLRVVDASAFPKIPALFPLMAIYAASERAADVILNDARTTHTA
ncbi:FAD-binding protein, partial [Dermatophilus congolensis]